MNLDTQQLIFQWWYN